jgi:hypothetical protein
MSPAPYIVSFGKVIEDTLFNKGRYDNPDIVALITFPPDTQFCPLTLLNIKGEVVDKIMNSLPVHIGYVVLPPLFATVQVIPL